mgnify:CR=1 FL=1
MGCTCACDKEKLFNSGVLVEHTEGAVLPPKEAWEAKKGGYAVIECPKRIPCTPCYTSCPTGAVLPFEDINDVPRIDYAKCTGCGICRNICRVDGISGIVPARVFHLGTVALGRFPQNLCARCGTPVPRGSELCGVCLSQTQRRRPAQEGPRDEENR